MYETELNKPPWVCLVVNKRLEFINGGHLLGLNILQVSLTLRVVRSSRLTHEISSPVN